MHDLEPVLAYHQATKHQPGRYARGPGHLDWATQPDPFRRYHGAPLLPLERIVPGQEPEYHRAFQVGRIPPAPLSRRSISQLFFDSLALSAWKQAGQARWALRVNPSSGNLHPTEGYLICGAVPGLSEQGLVAHYAPAEHALEVRAQFPTATWHALSAGLPAGAVLVGLSSIHWREAWKYGERAFRYCQHDVGHAIAALSLAAAGLGWQATLLDGASTEQIAQLLGLADPQGAEPEHPDCLLAVYPQGQSCQADALPQEPIPGWAGLRWLGRPNRLSPSHVPWPAIEQVAAATEKPATPGAYRSTPTPPDPQPDPSLHSAPCASTAPDSDWTPPPLSLRRIIHQRRSAVAMDPSGTLGRKPFLHILAKMLPRPGQFPFNALPWPPCVHLALFVHRVEGLQPGLYLLLRTLEQEPALRSALRADLAWERPPACPANLPLFQMLAGDARAAAQQLSCFQEIAGAGCFSLGMIAHLAPALRRYGPWFYRRLFWECGLIGQVLYL
jgi:SagB-type dehydrogenase family enzyme